MALTDPCVIFSTIVWFLVTFVSFFSFFTSNKNFLGILKNLKFRKKKLIYSLFLMNELDSLNSLLVIIYSILFRWLKKWGKLLLGLTKRLMKS
jgi:hypothetical protein